MYSFRRKYQLGAKTSYEVVKWGDDKEPTDVYIVVTGPRSYTCNCYARGECKHIKLIKQIIEAGVAHELQYHLWDYDNGWIVATDLEYA